MCAGRASHFSIAPRFDPLPPFTTLRLSSNSMDPSWIARTRGTADHSSRDAVPQRPGGSQRQLRGRRLTGGGRALRLACPRLGNAVVTRVEEAIEISTMSDQTVVKKSIGRTVKAYVALTKPRVLELLLVSTVPVMFLAQGGLPDMWLVLATVIGGSLSAGSAAAFNMYLDRDIDAHMHRTENRPLVTGEITPRGALIFSWTLAVLSTVWLWFTTNWLAATLSASAIFFYVVIYTMILKRRTEQNIIWGGIAGCFPVLIGWAAVTGSLDWPAFILFALIFLWTPPHYWPLSMKYKDDYDDVDVPMLGVTRNASQVGLQVILYAWATVACSLLLIPIANMGLVYGVSAAVFGGWFIYESHRLYNQAVRGNEARPMRVFHASITYLTLIFVAVAVDPLLPF